MLKVMNGETCNTVFILGANGFVGKEICKYFEKISLSFVPVTRTGAVTNKVNEVTYEDFYKYLKSNDNNSGIIVINAVGKAHIKKNKNDDVAEFSEANIDFCKTLGDVLLQSCVGKLVHISSISARESDRWLSKNSESSLLGCANNDPYSISKKMGEQELYFRLNNSQTKLIILRPSLIYGCNPPGNFNALIKGIQSNFPLPLKSFTNKKSFLSGYNLGSFVHACILRTECDDMTIALGDPDSGSVSQFVKNIYAAMGKRNQSFWVPNWLLRVLFKLIGKNEVYDKLSEELFIDMTEISKRLEWNQFETQKDALKRIYLEGV